MSSCSSGEDCSCYTVAEVTAGCDVFQGASCDSSIKLIQGCTSESSSQVGCAGC
ncbi:hypothetical protein BDU57DRAFT_515570 [Ampelomyces quisqualis]|uniref:Uncharacterized protein n=1 Tax=Ampelomyces quisqualis TaxID=50730 RepID=A0A6A5QLY3_AMPQU|nr:hypothetical protein BDU57DRAFT_515570 [Ampelomyces quisqualis]